MSIRSGSRRFVFTAGLALVPALLFSTASLAGRHGAIGGQKPAYVAYDFDVAIDQAAPGAPDKVGDHDHLRIVFDRSQVVAHRVRLLNMQHFKDGKYQPERPDSVSMPMDDSWLDLSHKPYALHYRAAVTHGAPIVIELDEHSHRLTIHSQDPPQDVVIAGPYLVDPRPITGPEIDAAATSGG